jgi:hypothetical protein
MIVLGKKKVEAPSWRLRSSEPPLPPWEPDAYF